MQLCCHALCDNSLLQGLCQCQRRTGVGNMEMAVASDRCHGYRDLREHDPCKIRMYMHRTTNGFDITQTYHTGYNMLLRVCNLRFPTETAF